MEDDPPSRSRAMLPYERWIANALRHVVVQAIEQRREHGLPGDHRLLHFRAAPRIPEFAIPPPGCAQYPGGDDDRPATSLLGPDLRP